MKSPLPFLMLLAAATVLPVAQAHHSFAAEFDTAKPVKMTGVVTKVEWQNPHIWFYVDVKGDDGKVTNWGFSGGAPGPVDAARHRQESDPGRHDHHRGRIPLERRLQQRQRCARDVSRWAQRVHRRRRRSRSRRWEGQVDEEHSACTVRRAGMRRSRAKQEQRVSPHRRWQAQFQRHLRMAQSHERRAMPLLGDHLRPQTVCAAQARRRSRSTNRAPAIRATTSRAISACPPDFRPGCSRPTPCSSSRPRTT